MKHTLVQTVAGTAVALALLAWPARTEAHCDTLDGPVVKAARLALAQGDVTPVLRWVRPADEAEIREAFRRAVIVRAEGPEAQALADQFFFETLVRVHRMAEGAPYTGLKPAGSVEPAIALADRALETGSADALVEEMTHAVADGLRARFAEAAAAARQADTGVEAGRAFVAAYVEFIHYAEGLHVAATSAGSGHGAAAHVPAIAPAGAR